MRNYQATGITLSVKKFRGSERLVVFYTREHGKVEAIAKGIGKPGSKLAPLVELLTLSKLFFATGRDIDYLTQGEVIDSFYELRRQVRRYGYACYIAEITASATEPGLPNRSIFEALRVSLPSMQQSDDPQLIMWAYSLNLLGELGLAPVLQRCVHCGGPLAGTVAYQSTEGGLACGNCQPPLQSKYVVSGATRGILRSLMNLPVNRLGRLDVSPQSRQQISNLLRQHIGYHLGLQPKSEQFLTDLNAASADLSG